MHKQEKKNALRRWKAEQLQIKRSKLPLSNRVIQELFDTLDIELPKYGCDRSRRLTKKYLLDNNLLNQSVLEWLDDNGGFCDCEVLANVKDSWEQLLD